MYDDYDDFRPVTFVSSPYADFVTLAKSYTTAEKQPEVSLEQRVEQYLAIIIAAKKPPTLAGLARALGVNSGHLREAIREYSSAGLYTETYLGTVMSYAFSFIEEYVETGMLDGSINASAAKFFLSRLGWDTPATTTSMTLNLTVSQIDAKLNSLLGETVASQVIDMASASPALSGYVPVITKMPVPLEIDDGN